MMIDARTQLVTLIGDPVEHSQSPIIHNAAFRAQDINAVYVATRVGAADIEAAVAGLKALRFMGANVTIPHKQAVLPLLDDCSDEARAVGAVNTIVRREANDGAALLYGDNTDVAGFLDPLRTLDDGRLTGSHMVIFGSGGAARAVAYALLTTYAPARLTLAARTPATAERLAQDLSAYDPNEALRVVPMPEAGPAVRASTLLVNATPLGMHPHTDSTPWPAAAGVTSDHIAYDLVYHPSTTRFMRDAAAQGATTLGGLGMLVAQAAAAYRQWTGRPMPTEAVGHALNT